MSQHVIPLNMKGCICHFVADTPFHIQRGGLLQVTLFTYMLIGYQYERISMAFIHSVVLRVDPTILATATYSNLQQMVVCSHKIEH